MRKRTPKPPVPTIRRRKLPRLMLTILFTIMIAGSLVYSLGWLGDLARQHLGPRDRYRVTFAHIDCGAPPGTNHATFLSEVRYASNFPETFQLLDPELSPKLSAAFASHPWVESIDGIDVERPSRVRVRIRFRTPILAVNVQSGGVRLVDANGILLPLCESPAGLAELVPSLPDPEIASGKVWPNAVVSRAVELVKIYQPKRLEKTTGWKLTGTDGKVLYVSG